MNLCGCRFSGTILTTIRLVEVWLLVCCAEVGKKKANHITILKILMSKEKQLGKWKQ
jgi:hypothetical protein